MGSQSIGQAMIAAGLVNFKSLDFLQMNLVILLAAIMVIAYKVYLRTKK